MSFAAGEVFKTSGIACIVVDILVEVKNTTQINSRIDNYSACTWWCAWWLCMMCVVCVLWMYGCVYKYNCVSICVSAFRMV